ncbi:hypothetical protein M231_02916 [Tremella mesenterica]|uniref:Tet-like 2OG-Fe(II) oxygenase domain-containing protein n=1 Tax=Tremella mesenterica TaxID=5217 RepID=A0A4Q1BPB2_TREME|nr:hypothetical protein M231_02916 [Tremella mesenterica]
MNGPAKSGGGHGRMHAFGWKGSFAGGVTRFDQYAPRPGREDEWKGLTDGKITQVARHLVNRFGMLYRHGLQEVEGHAAKEGIPRFDAAHVDLDIGEPDNLPSGANSLTVTCDGFSNIHHRDRDTSPWAFGIFWSGKSKGGRFTGEVSDVSEEISGGEFWWAEYGVAVGAAPDHVYAEVAWRAPRDYHGTLACNLRDGLTWKTATMNRWACSMQITKRLEDKIKATKALGGYKPGHVATRL